MKEVLSQTISLLRRYPILWLPQLCAMCLVLVVQKIYALAATAIWHMLWHPPASSGSIFDLPYPPTPGVLMERSMLTIPLLLLTNFIEIALCATACVVIAIFVSRIVRGLAIDPRSAWRSTKPRSSGIIYLALVTIGIVMLKMLISFLLGSWWSSRPGFSETPLWKISAFGWAIDIVFFLAIACFITPIALSIAGAEESFLPSTQEIRWSRLFAVITLIAWTGLQFGWRKVEHNLIISSYDRTALWFFALSCVSTVISAAALTFLSTALAVTANGNANHSLSSEEIPA